ncbi:MAG: hypothetical protein IPO08_21865, partial [Xanthomonadales bacterium]|nr:hypothetical protein [Xanthomonadales bacterium]
MRRRIVIAGCVLGLALAVGLVTPAGAQFVSQYLARTFTSSAPSGVNGFVCKTAGCRVDLGPGANDFWYSDGASIKTDGPVSTISTYVSTAATNNNGFALTQNYARMDLGAGANDYLYSDGNRASVAGELYVNSTLSVASGVLAATNAATPVWLRGGVTATGTAIANKITNVNALGSF